MPRRSGRVVSQPERFIGLGEILVDPETDPVTTMKQSKTRIPYFGKVR